MFFSEGGYSSKWWKLSIFIRITIFYKGLYHTAQLLDFLIATFETNQDFFFFLLRVLCLSVSVHFFVDIWIVVLVLYRVEATTIWH